MSRFLLDGGDWCSNQVGDDFSALCSLGLTAGEQEQGEWAQAECVFALLKSVCLGTREWDAGARHRHEDTHFQTFRGLKLRGEAVKNLPLHLKSF